jgi:lantibiotic modifying enzyme
MNDHKKKDNSLIYGVIGIILFFTLLNYMTNADWYSRLEYGSISECIGKKQSQFDRTLNEMDEENLSQYDKFLKDEKQIDRLAEKQCRELFKNR